jgi:hypothetical protein
MGLIREKRKIPLSLHNAVSKLETAFFLTATEFATKIRPLLSLSEAQEMDVLLSKMAPKYPYKLAKLNNKEGDLSKRWYVEYEVWDKGTSKLERKFQYISQKLKTKDEREKYAAKLIQYINSNLTSGNVLDSQPKEDTTRNIGTHRYFIDVLNEAFSIKKKSIQQKKTLVLYEMYTRFITLYLEEKGKGRIEVEDFDTKEAVSLFDWLEEDYHRRNKKLMSNRTYNNYKGFIFSLFNEMVHREHLFKNPIRVIKERKIKESANLPFDTDSKRKILDHLKKSGKFDLYYFCKFIYYTLGRPTELIKLQCKHVMEDKIMFKGGLSKNSKTQFIPITEGCRDLLKEMGVYQAPPEGYLFSRTGVGGKSATGENQFGQRHTAVIRELGYGLEYTLYTWKDTGACDLYLATKDIMLVKTMCRHASVQETEIYLRGLGVLVDYSETKNAPKLEA